MGAGSKELYTVWTALDDILLRMGPLALCLGSHEHQKLREPMEPALPIRIYRRSIRGNGKTRFLLGFDTFSGR